MLGAPWVSVAGGAITHHRQIDPYDHVDTVHREKSGHDVRQKRWRASPRRDHEVEIQACKEAARLCHLEYLRPCGQGGHVDFGRKGYDVVSHRWCGHQFSLLQPSALKESSLIGHVFSTVSSLRTFARHRSSKRPSTMRGSYCLL